MLKAIAYNRFMGTHLTPWELKEVPDEWIEAIDMVKDDLPKVKDWQDKIDESLARLRRRDGY